MRDFVKARRVGVVVTLFHLADHFFGPVEAVGEMAVVLLIAGFVSAAFQFVNGGASRCQRNQFRLGSHRGGWRLLLSWLTGHSPWRIKSHASRLCLAACCVAFFWCLGVSLASAILAAGIAQSKKFQGVKQQLKIACFRRIHLNAMDGALRECLR